MNLPSISVPQTCAELIEKLEDYYFHEFYLEMVRMSNTGLNSYIDDYLEMLVRLTNKLKFEDTARAAIGVVCLYKFGYKDFRRLSTVFDRVLPQKDVELVKFTSYCAGYLIHHPNAEQVKYVVHLCERALGWVRASGRRARYFAATKLIAALAKNAGNTMLMFLPNIKTTMWRLITSEDMHVLSQNAVVVRRIMVALDRYAGGELNRHLAFFSNLCRMLVSLAVDVKVFAGLEMYRALIRVCPDYFTEDIREILDFADQVDEYPVFVKVSSVKLMVAIAAVESKMFIETCGDELIEKLKQVVFEDPKAVAKGLRKLALATPEFVKEKVDDIEDIAEMMVRKQVYDNVFELLVACFQILRERVLLFFQRMFDVLVEAPLSINYKEFFVQVALTEKVLTDDMKNRICQRISTGLAGDNNVIALDLVAALPTEFFTGKKEIFDLVAKLASNSSYITRCSVPAALFNVVTGTGEIEGAELMKTMLKKAIFDQNLHVRDAYLHVVYKNCSPYLATEEFMRFFKIFLNDDAYSVREITLKILSELARYNPLRVSSMMRECILDYFGVLKNVPSIRQRARIARILPTLISSSLTIVRSYSQGLIEIFESALQLDYQTQTYANFIEENSASDIRIGLIDSLGIIAPHDPDTVSRCADRTIPLLCAHLTPDNSRLVILSVLKTLLVLLSPPVSTVEIRKMSPEIISICSSFLAETRSRKIRIAILKVIGAIGILEIQRKPPPKSCESPQNVNEDLARQFYHPFRDTDGIVDDSLLVKQACYEQYNISVVATTLLRIFNDPLQRDLYVDIVGSLVDVLSQPKMHSLAYFDEFVTRLLDFMDTCSDEEIVQILPLYSKLIEQSSHNTTPFVSRSLDIILKRWTPDLAIPFIEVILSFLFALKNGFSTDASRTICLLIRCLDASMTNREASRRVLHAFSILGQFAADYRYLIVPQICNAIDCEQTDSLVRVMGLETLRILVDKTDIIMFIGPVIRSLCTGLSSKDEHTKDAAQQLLYSMILSGEYRKWLETDVECNNAGVSQIRAALAMAEDEIRQLIKPHGSNFVEKETRVAAKEPVFAEDTVVARAAATEIGLARDLSAFARVVIMNSPSKSIRACYKIANTSSRVAIELFKPAFFSCWLKISEEGQKTISESFLEIISAKEDHRVVAREILDLMFFMDKIEHRIDLPNEIVTNSAMRYGCDAFALCLLERMLSSSTKMETIFKLMNVLLKLDKWHNAVAIWKLCSESLDCPTSTEVFAMLHMWDKAENPYREAYTSTGDHRVFKNLLRTLSKLAKWNDITELISAFDIQSKDRKQKVAKFFAQASINLGKWDDAGHVLAFAPQSSFKCNIFTAMNALHNGNWTKVDSCFEQGFSLLAAKPIAFWDDHQGIHRDTVLAAQELIELKEMKMWLTNPEIRSSTECVWHERLTTAPQEFEVWLELLNNRITITGKREDSLVRFFQLRSLSLGTKIHKNAFDIIFPNFNYESGDDLSRVCYAVEKWYTGEQQDALSLMKTLCEQVVAGDLKTKCEHLYCTWLLEQDDSIDALKTAYERLGKTVAKLDLNHISTYKRHSSASIRARSLQRGLGSSKGTLHIPNQLMNKLITDAGKIEIMRKWAEINSELIQRDAGDSVVEYVSNTINALTKCIRIAPSFPDVVQLLNLFFEYADEKSVFEAGMSIEQLNVKLLLQAAPQMLVQLSHKSREVAEFVHKIILSLLHEHYHSLIFSILVLEKSNDGSRAHAAISLLNEFHRRNRAVTYEIDLIRQGLLRAAVTWYERALLKLQDADNCEQQNDIDGFTKNLRSIVKMIQKPKCRLHHQFIADYQGPILMIEKLLETYKKKQAPHALRDLKRFRADLQEAVNNTVHQIHRIQLSSISEELCQKTNFNLAVPGTYVPDHPVIRIEYFVDQFGVYTSKQQPKNVVLRGTDGNFYQYLLKGHEDLRLDERIMQFFRLINSLVKKETSQDAYRIQTTSVIPLSLLHGLVQWVRGTDTLRAIVEQYRTLHGRDSMEEYTLLDRYSHSRFDSMLPIQKMQVIERVARELPDSDLTNFFWLKASSAEIWLKQSTTFAISTAISSIVGYIIGLGDRHPSNLLIDRISGKVIHIDFGDCFERAANRSYLPEVVPFRLTRMMVKAMGVTGVDGTFRSSFVNMSRLLRKNRHTLLMVLAIFVQEPLVDPEMAFNMSAQQSTENLKRSGSVHKEESATEGIQIHRSMSKIILGSGFDDGRIPFHESNPTLARSDEEIRDRVRDKLYGNDFEPGAGLSVEEQAKMLIDSATDMYNLAKMYHGWCPFW